MRNSPITRKEWVETIKATVALVLVWMGFVAACTWMASHQEFYQLATQQ